MATNKPELEEGFSICLCCCIYLCSFWFYRIILSYCYFFSFLSFNYSKFSFILLYFDTADILDFFEQPEELLIHGLDGATNNSELSTFSFLSFYSLTSSYFFVGLSSWFLAELSSYFLALLSVFSPIIRTILSFSSRLLSSCNF